MSSFIRLLIILTIFCVQNCLAAIVSSDEEIVNIDSKTYTVESIGPSDDPDEIVVDDQLFDPKTYCDIAPGDKIKFIVHTPDDCVDAKILNLRTRMTCDIWCES